MGIDQLATAENIEEFPISDKDLEKLSKVFNIDKEKLMDPNPEIYYTFEGKKVKMKLTVDKELPKGYAIAADSSRDDDPDLLIELQKKNISAPSLGGL
ncbi:MAG: hypothetical protein NTZ97_05135 [Candidatus Moranbacteria bacterium]|nr:hypothetical protein [Candidatus Moranbacteria bacterium]